MAASCTCINLAGGQPMCDELPDFSPEVGSVRELTWEPRKATDEKRPEQCTNPFILLVRQRLVRAGWSQHVCGAPSCPPPRGRALVSGWGPWLRKHREGGARCGKGRAGVKVCPCLPPLGCKQRLLGHPGAFAQGSLPRPGDPCVQRQVGAAGYSQPETGPAALSSALALLQESEWGSRQRGEGHRGWPPGTVGTRGWESEQRTRGRMERRGAPWHRDTNARTGASGAKTQTSERRGRGDEAGGPLPRACLCTRLAERGARSSRC